ncbi:hypothetical protein V8E55_011605 [Tylopilus felleus]
MINKLRRRTSSTITCVLATLLDLTPVYACTGYRSQVQTVPVTIVDLTTTLGHFEPFQPIHLALSHSKGQENIRLLRDFDDRFFQAARNLDLIQEDDIQVTLDPSLTNEWWQRIRLGTET